MRSDTWNHLRHARLIETWSNATSVALPSYTQLYLIFSIFTATVLEFDEYISDT